MQQLLLACSCRPLSLAGLRPLLLPKLVPARDTTQGTIKAGAMRLCPDGHLGMQGRPLLLSCPHCLVLLQRPVPPLMLQAMAAPSCAPCLCLMCCLAGTRCHTP